MVNRIRSKPAEASFASSSTPVATAPTTKPLVPTARSLPKFQCNTALAMQYKFPDSKLAFSNNKKSEAAILSEKASPKDLPAIRKFFDSLDHESRSFRLGTDEEVAATVIESLANSTSYDSAALLRKDSAGSIVGIVDYADNSTQDERIADIGIVVGKNYRKGGVGSSLLKEIEDCVKQEGYDSMAMIVYSKNTKMINWMRNKNWKESDELAPLLRFTKNLSNKLD